MEYKESAPQNKESNSKFIPQDQKVKILVIDDEESIRNAINKFFLKSGIKSVGIDNGKVGLEQYITHSNEYNLVILDVNLPGLNGVEIYKKMKSVTPTQQFLFITGYSDFQMPDLKEKNVHILSKPFELSELQKIITEILGIELSPKE
jgi:DNA-binding NtrC family response regulator